MYEKFTSIALLFAIAVNAQDEESTADVLDPAPMPAYPEDKGFYTPIEIPSDEDFGDFPNNIAYAGFALWDDSENTDLICLSFFYCFLHSCNIFRHILLIEQP